MPNDMKADALSSHGTKAEAIAEAKKRREAGENVKVFEVNFTNPRTGITDTKYEVKNDSSSLPALDPAKLDACAKMADALASRMDAMIVRNGKADSLDGKFQHHKGKDNVRPDDVTFRKGQKVWYQDGSKGNREGIITGGPKEHKGSTIYEVKLEKAEDKYDRNRWGYEEQFTPR